MRKKHGYASIYTLLIMIPVLAICFALAEITFTDHHIVYQLIHKQQAEYNSEMGLCDGMKRCTDIDYDNCNQARYYLDFLGEIKFSTVEPMDKDYVKIVITYSTLEKERKYYIDSYGIFQNIEIKRSIVYNKS